ncbi:MAG: shikimate kinase [Defluviitaleaceae bacterium]|nr:shikimate kinase [Defluviitaleaceae bacterium]
MNTTKPRNLAEHKPNIILIGMMGSGKTSVGTAIGNKHGMIFVDTDTVIEERSGMLISQIFEEYGETYFRELEAQAAKVVAGCKNAVIATGGGIILNAKNMALLRKIGFVVYLQLEPQQLYNRLKTDTSRPLLANLSNRAKQAKINEIFSRRAPLYQRYSDFAINNSVIPITKVARMIFNEYKNHANGENSHN